MRDVIVIFHFGLFWHFDLLPPPNIPKNKNFKKNEKRKKNNLQISFYTSVPEIMIICCTVMVHDRCHYFSFWAIFCPLNFLTA